MDNLTYDNCSYLINKREYNYRPMLDTMCLFVLVGALTSVETLELRSAMSEPLPTEDAGTGTQTPGADDANAPPAE